MSKITLDSGRSVEIQDEATAALVSDFIERLQKQVTDSSAELDKRQATIDGQAEQITTLKVETSDEAVSARVTAVIDAQTKAAKVAPEVTCDSLNPLEIQRAALAKARPTIDWAGKSDAYVQAAFDMAVEQAEATDPHADQKRNLAQDASSVRTSDSQTTLDAAYQARMERISNDWKGE